MRNNIEREDLNVLINYLKASDPKLTHGPCVEKFESDWSNWLGVQYSVMVNSGSSANDLTMLLLREMVGLGEVIVPGLTWVSDIASVLHAGFKPVFVDIKLETLGMDTDLILNAITPNTRAVFITHALGFNALTDKLILELKRLGIKLIEDVCESHGAMHGSSKLGAVGWVSNFSFYYAHHLTTIEGGMICTDDPDLYDLARMMRSHGLVRESRSARTINLYKTSYPDLNPDFIFAFPAHNMRPTELNGILGSSQLSRLDANVEKRKKNLVQFLSELDHQKFFTDFKLEGNSNYAFTLILKKPSLYIRNVVESVLSSERIEFRRGLSGGGNQLRQPYLQKALDLPKPEELEITDFVHNFAWYIGNYPSLKASEITWLTTILNEIF
jgi:CDP-6-deoxy-D-xylo-4-hexulose-3-dehydrase